MKKGFLFLSILVFILTLGLSGCKQSTQNALNRPDDKNAGNDVVSNDQSDSRHVDNDKYNNHTDDTNSDHNSGESIQHNDGGRCDTIYPFYTMTDGEADMAALLFLGGRDEVTAGQAAAQERYFSALPNQWPVKTETVETAEWQETYLLLPKYPGTVIDVYELDQEERIVSRLISTEHAVLLRCNHSDIMPSTEVRIQYQDRTVIFRPHMSLRDGSCVAEDGIYTQVFHRS